MIEIKDLKINFHLFEQCNMHCVFCYRNKTKNFKIKTLDDYKNIIDRLHELEFRQINYAGGEPTLFNDLDKLLKYSQELGFTNSIISNGYIKDKNNIENITNKLLEYLDTYGLSIDSLDENINKNSGRCINVDNIVTLEDIYRIYTCVKNEHKKFKINTVVTKLNKDDYSLLKIIDKGIIVDRWKILRVHPAPLIDNSKYQISDEEYIKFVDIIKEKYHNVCIEDKNEMINSYIMVDGNGNLSFDSTTKEHKEINIFTAINEEIINFINDNLDKEKYLKRYQN